MQTHRLRSPQGNGSILADPALNQAAATLAANADRFAPWDHDFQGRRADWLRNLARTEVLQAARAFHIQHNLDLPDGPSDPARLVVTGHQPELFHPGVWVKNFALGAVGQQAGAVALNLIVDNDIPKGPAIRVPYRDGEHLYSGPVAFDTWRGELPYEDQPVVDEAMFGTFADRVRERTGELLPHSLLDTFWSSVVARRATTDRVGLRFALARREQEAQWGTRNWEVPLSAVCETEAFAWFACHLLANLNRFQAIHNTALDNYREAYHLRSKNHPVPALGAQGEWLEAPFWVWRRESPRRKPLLVRQQAQVMDLRIAGEDEAFLSLPLGPDREACCSVEPLMALRTQGIRLRTRALTTTLFARYLLGDLFLHGIGGAKYDELGDEIARSFFGIEPPTFLTLSLTSWLPLPDSPASLDHLRALNHALRDREFNPDRHLGESGPSDARLAVAAKWAAIKAEVSTRSQRKARLRAIRQANAALAPFVRSDQDHLAVELSETLVGLKRNVVAHSREYAFPLHNAESLHSQMQTVIDRIG